MRWFVFVAAAFTFGWSSLSSAAESEEPIAAPTPSPVVSSSHFEIHAAAGDDLSRRRFLTSVETTMYPASSRIGVAADVVYGSAKKTYELNATQLVNARSSLELDLGARSTLGSGIVRPVFGAGVSVIRFEFSSVAPFGPQRDGTDYGIGPWLDAGLELALGGFRAGAMLHYSTAHTYQLGPDVDVGNSTLFANVGWSF